MDKVMLIIRSGPGEVSRVEEGLRLSASMLGMDYPHVLVFVDEGVRCLRPGALRDTGLMHYLEASADLAGFHVLSDSLSYRGLDIGDLDPRFEATQVDISHMAEMVADNDVIVAL